MGCQRRVEPAAAVADGGDRLRLFIAVEVPEAHKLSIERAIQKLRMALPQARWTPRESWHATVKFLGEVPDDRFDDVVRVARKVTSEASSTESHLTEVGAFPSLRRARVLWVGLDDSSVALAKLAKTLESRYGRRGFRKESRDLHPHLTLARLRVPRPLASEVEEAGPYKLEPSSFPISEAVLYRSHLSPKGATYEVIEKFSLGAS